MAMQRRFRVAHSDVFPAGAFVKGAAEAVLDYNAPRREDGSRPQQVDKDTGMLLWQVTVIDADEAASKRETAVSVKIAAPVAPVPPERRSPGPWTQVEFVGLAATPYIEEMGEGRSRIAWSFRAEGMVAPGAGDKQVA